MDYEAERFRLAAEMGLDPEELEGVTPEQIDAVTRPGPLHGRYRITRRARDVVPVYLGLLLAPMLAGLGAATAGAGLAAVVVVAALVHHRRRLARFDVDALGRLDIRHAGPIDWADVDAVSYRLRYPWLSSSAGIERAAGTTAEIRIRRTAARDLRLAQGQLFQIRPQRRPVSLDVLSRHLRTQARSAGLTVTRLAGERAGWAATRAD